MVNDPPGSPDGFGRGSEPAPSSVDAELIRRTAGGDRDAFEALYRRYAAPIMSFLHHLTFDRGLAEDATQDVFVKVWRAAKTFRPGFRFSTWLFQIAKNHAFGEIPRWRRQRAAGGESPATGAAPAGRAAADADVRRGEITRGIADALEGLSDKLRVAFVLVRLEGRPYAEAAEILEVPEGTVKSRMAAAEAALRVKLGKFL